MVPTIVEFQIADKTADAAEGKLRQIAAGMGRAESLHPRKMNDDSVLKRQYIPVISELVLTEGEVEPTKKTEHFDIEWEPGVA
jgi:hypothetical protein